MTRFVPCIHRMNRSAFVFAVFCFPAFALALPALAFTFPTIDAPASTSTSVVG
jgi:hypothetical protein